MKPTICDLVNPSDAITFVCTDAKVAGVSILILGRGAYALKDVRGNEIVPLGLFGTYQTWLDKEEIDLDKFIPKNRIAMAEFLETVCYGTAAEREAVDVACGRMTKEKAEEHRLWWNDRRRGSLNDIGKGAFDLAKALRENAKELPAQTPIILVK